MNKMEPETSAKLINGTIMFIVMFISLIMVFIYHNNWVKILIRNLFFVFLCMVIYANVNCTPWVWNRNRDVIAFQHAVSCGNPTWILSLLDDGAIDDLESADSFVSTIMVDLRFSYEDRVYILREILKHGQIKDNQTIFSLSSFSTWLMYEYENDLLPRYLHGQQLRKEG